MHLGRGCANTCDRQVHLSRRDATPAAGRQHREPARLSRPRLLCASGGRTVLPGASARRVGRRLSAPSRRDEQGWVL